MKAVLFLRDLFLQFVSTVGEVKLRQQGIDIEKIQEPPVENR